MPPAPDGEPSLEFILGLALDQVRAIKPLEQSVTEVHERLANLDARLELAQRRLQAIKAVLTWDNTDE